MKTLKRVATIGTSVGFALLVLMIIGQALGGRGEGESEGGGVPLAPIQTGVRVALGELAQEKAEADRAAELDATDNAVSAAHSEVLVTLEEFRRLKQDIVECNRRNAIEGKLEAQKAQGISFERGLDVEMKAAQERWTKWNVESRGAVSGEADLIDEPRALIDDTVALLAAMEGFYSGQSGPTCQETLEVALYNLNQTATAVAAGFEQKEELSAALMGEEAIKVNWAQFRGTGNAQYRANIERLAKQHDIDLSTLGIDLNSIAVVE